MNGNGQISEAEFESARSKLRSCWELASVLNFWKVFEPIMGSDLKISAEEIEQSLIVPDKRLRQLHIGLLKGIPPVSRNLREPDAWVVTLSKKLFMWWPWVAQGDFPLTAAKGAEMETYKNLDPTVRAIILKALCEIRADQHDVIAYINDAVKVKKDISAFRKKNIGEDGRGTSYWLDGNEAIGLRLYKEVNTLTENEAPPTMSYQWETLATNLEEFQKVVDEYSSSESKLEVAVSVAVETEAIPILSKMFKKQQRELEKKKKEVAILNNSSRLGATRSCRNRNPITYTFDEYDKVISEAIKESNKTKATDEQKSVKKATAAYEDSPQQADEGESTESEENDVHEETGEEYEENAGSDDSGEEESEENVGSESDDSGEESEEAVVSEDSGDESDENDEDDRVNKNLNSKKDGKTKSRDKKRVEKEETEESEDGESTESDFDSAADSDSENSELETKDISEDGEDNNKENTNSIIVKEKNTNSIIVKENTENGDRFIQEKEHFGTKKRLVQRPNRNTALESAVVPDSEDEEVSSESSDDE